MRPAFAHGGGNSAVGVRPSPAPHITLEVALIEFAQQVELTPRLLARERRVANVLDEALEGGVARVDVSALVGAGQEAALPVLRLLDRVAARAHRDEAGQVLVLAAQAV